MSKLLRREVGIVNVPAKLLFVSLALQLQIKVDRNQRLLPLTCVLARDISSGGSQHELLVHSFIKSGIAGTTRVETVEPLGKSILYFDVMPLDLALQPQGESRVVDARLPGHVDLLDVVLGERLQHLRADVLLACLNHILCWQSTTYLLHACIYIQQLQTMDRFLDRAARPSCLHKAKSSSTKNKTITSLDERFTSKVYTSPVKPAKGNSHQLIAENQKLRRENEILQEYFETFEERYREQRKENEALRRQLKDIRKGKDVRSPQKKSQVTHCLSERTLVQKMSRANKSSKANPLTQYL